MLSDMEQSTPTAGRRYTVEQYLAMDDASADVRYEYRDGDVLAMAGTTFTHGRIVRNLSRRIGERLDGTPCEVFLVDIRVKVDRSRYSYPDLGVVCGPTFDPPDGDVTLTNPRVLIEVLSDSTESADRGEKFFRYMGVSSLDEYVLCRQDRPRAELFYRQPNGVWAIGRFVEGLDATLQLRSVSVEVPMRQVYEGVTFPPAGPPPPDDPSTA